MENVAELRKELMAAYNGLRNGTISPWQGEVLARAGAEIVKAARRGLQKKAP